MADRWSRQNWLALVANIATMGLLYPTGANVNTEAAGTQLAGGMAWAYGAWVEVIAAAGIAVDFWLVGIYAYNIVALDDFVVQVGSGLGGAEVTRAKAEFNADGYWPLPVPLKFPANTRLPARVANAGGAANTLRVKLAIATGLGS